MKGFELQMEGPNAKLKVLGPIDETCEFPAKVKCDILVIDFEHHTIINSYGVRLWLEWMRDKRGYKKLHLRNCKPSFLAQASNVKGVIPANVRVESFYLPFYDLKTDESLEVKMVYGKDYNEKTITFPKCKGSKGQDMELDIPMAYLEFLKNKA